MGYTVIKMPSFERLPKAVSTHIDMLMFYDGEKIITHREYYEKNKSIFNSLNIETLTTDEYISNEYPNDILFNAVLTKDGFLFSKTNKTSKLIKDRAKVLVNVRQGYTSCSTCRVSDKAFITTDRGLYDAYIKNDIDSLFVESEGIFLPGYNCGFIGGASVTIEEFVCFFGDIRERKDYRKIRSFVEKYGKKVLSLSNEKLTDIGGGIVV